MCGHTMGCALDRAFPSASVNISQPPVRLGARSSAEEDGIFVPDSPEASGTNREWPCRKEGSPLGSLAFHGWPLSSTMLGTFSH